MSHSSWALDHACALLASSYDLLRCSDIKQHLRAGKDCVLIAGASLGATLLVTLKKKRGVLK